MPVRGGLFVLEVIMDADACEVPLPEMQRGAWDSAIDGEHAHFFTSRTLPRLSYVQIILHDVLAWSWLGELALLTGRGEARVHRHEQEQIEPKLHNWMKPAAQPIP